MLDVINALKNNNMRKIPQYDPTLFENMKKLLKHLNSGKGIGRLISSNKRAWCLFNLEALRCGAYRKEALSKERFQSKKS